MRLEDLSNEQRKTWEAMSTIRNEAEKTGTIPNTHIKRWHEDLARLNQDLHLHQAKRELELKAEQQRQNEQLLATVKTQQEQQQRQQEIIEELRRTQQTWQTYVEKELPTRVLATVQAAQDRNPTHQEIEDQIAAMIRENQPAPAPPTNMLTKEAADELIAAALAQQAQTNETAMQKAIEEAAQKARETAGPSREEIQRMINARRRRRDSNVADPNQPSPNKPNPNEPAPNAAPTGGQHIIVKVDLPERFHRKPATEPWLYGGNFSEDLRAWLLACEDFFNWYPTEWETETDCIKYVVGRTKDNSKAHDFGISYRRSMEGIDGYPLKPLFARWAKFKAEIIERFEPKEEAMLAKQEMDSLRYKNNISHYLEKIRSLNYRVKMTGVSLRSLILAVVPAEVRNQLIFAPTYNDDDDWMELDQRIGQTLELAKRQEKLFEVKQVTSKKTTKTTKTYEDSSSWKKWGTQTTTSGKAPDTFPRPKNYQRLTDEEKAQCEARLKKISDDLQKKRKDRKLYIRCGQPRHGQYTCLTSRPVVSATTVDDTKKRKRVKE